MSSYTINSYFINNTKGSFCWDMFTCDAKSKWMGSKSHSLGHPHNYCLKMNLFNHFIILNFIDPDQLLSWKERGTLTFFTSQTHKVLLKNYFSVLSQMCFSLDNGESQLRDSSSVIWLEMISWFLKTLFTILKCFFSICEI